MRRYRSNLVWAVAMLGLLASCADLQAPEPVRRPALGKTWALPASTLVVPVRVPQAQVKAWTENAVPQSLKGEGSGQRTLSAWFLKHDWHYWWTYELRRSPLSLKFEGNRVRVAASLTGDLSARWDTLPGEISSEVEADAGVESVLGLGSDWRVVPRTQVFLEVRRADVPIGIAWDGNFFGETISIAKPVQDALRPSLEALGKDLDRRIAGLEFKPTVEAAWKDLQEPRQIPGTSGLWFSLAPRTVAVGPLKAAADFVGVDLTLTVQPSLISGPRPEPVNVPLPPVMEAQNLPSRILLNLPVALDWKEAVRLTRDLWAKKTPWDVGNGGKIRLKDLSADTDGDRVLMRVDALISPPWPGPEVEAILWLGARPDWDPVGRSFRLKDLALEIQTKDYLTKTASWLLAGLWVENLQKALVWDMGPGLDLMRSQAATTLNHLDLGHHLWLAASLEQGEVVDFTLTERGPEILTRWGGTATVTWVP